MTPKPPITIVGATGRKAREIPPMPDIPWRAVLIGVAILVAFVFLRDCFVLVPAGERAAIYSKVSGVQHRQLGEGLHLIWPIVYEPTLYDTKKITYTMSGTAHEAARPHEVGVGRVVPDDSLEALTSDGLPVTLDLSIRFQVDEDNVWKLHQAIGPGYIDKIVRPQTRSIVRMVFAQFPVTEVYSGRRQLIVERIQRELRETMARSFLVLDEVLLRDIRFPEDFQRAIEQKQVAQQAAQQMVYELDRARSERQRRVIEAQGEATAIRKKADALAAHPNLTQYEYVQNLPANVRVVVTDSRAIVNLGDLLNAPNLPVPTGTETNAQPAPEGNQP